MGHLGAGSIWKNGEQGVISHEGNRQNCLVIADEKANPRKTHGLVSILELVYDRVFRKARTFASCAQSYGMLKESRSPRPLYVGFMVRGGVGKERIGCRREEAGISRASQCLISVIDLTWFNEAAVQATTFSDLKIDWEGSLGSDHAMLIVAGHIREEVDFLNCEGDLGVVIDPEKCEEWTRAFKERSFHIPFQHAPSPDKVETVAASLTEDIRRTNEEILCRRHPEHPKASPWWNAACAIATQTLRDAHNAETRSLAQARLKGTVRAAKRKWADEYIEQAQLWDVAAWRHGRRLTKVPSLQGPEGLVHSHEGVADILSQRFFPRSPQEVNPHFPDDPPPHPPRLLAQIDKALVEPLLRKATNRSAPGQSGHTWTLIKWAWEADSDRIVNLLEACLRAGHHPRLWKEAIVSVIPKPKRSDYTLAKKLPTHIFAGMPW